MDKPSHTTRSFYPMFAIWCVSCIVPTSPKTDPNQGQVDSDTANAAGGAGPATGEWVQEQAFAGHEGTPVEVVLESPHGSWSITALEIEDYLVFEGDILLPNSDTAGPPPPPGAAKTLSTSFWSGCKVPYVIDGSVSAEKRALTEQAIAHVQANTIVQLIPRTSEKDYVSFAPGTSDSGCSSYIGRTGGMQPISLFDCTVMGNVAHEIMHALGVYHEQSRSDRDEFVRVLWDNIQADKTHNFQSYVESGDDGEDIGAYDFSSIMHYPSNAWAIDTTRPTLLKVNGEEIDTNRAALSSGDMNTVARVYGAPEHFANYSQWRDGHGRGSSNQFLADINGDGMDDSLVYFASGDWYAATSYGAGYNLYHHWQWGHGIGSSNQLMGDVNGDGADDAVVYFAETGDWYVVLAPGAGYYQHWRDGHGIGSTRQFLSDVNGDGRADAVVYFASGDWYVAESNGAGFNLYRHLWSGHGVGSADQLMGDVNGDGAADGIVYFASGDWYVMLSGGSGYYQHWIGGHGVGSSDRLLADVDGDGLADAVAYFNGAWHVARSNGAGFSSSRQWLDGHGVGSDRRLLGDSTGDGLADAVVYFATGDWYLSRAVERLCDVP